MSARKIICLLTILLLLTASAVAASEKNEAPAAKSVPAPALDPAPDPDKGRKPSLAWGNELYTHYCTPCHGIKGDGKGFNAPRLLIKPANHTDAQFMSERDDLKLFDTINLGGVQVAKSTLMPPWGAALNNDNKIKSLILKLRDLCRCEAAKKW